MSPNSQPKADRPLAEKNKSLWLFAKVIPGKQIGRKLGFPTINLDKPKLLRGKNEGVYACLVKINNIIYHGLLYYGPRLILNEKEKILEIFILDFKSEIYGKEIAFRLLDFIRKPEDFPTLDKFKKQLEKDSLMAFKIFTSAFKY